MGFGDCLKNNHCYLSYYITEKQKSKAFYIKSIKNVKNLTAQKTLTLFFYKNPVKALLSAPVFNVYDFCVQNFKPKQSH